MPDQLPPTLVFGDPHGDFASVREFCGYHDTAGTVIIVGDLDLERPLADELAPEIERGWDIRWIHGNHDTDREEFFSNLFCHKGGLMQHVSLIGGLRVAGLGGVFRGSVWNGVDAPAFSTRIQFFRSLKVAERWHKGLPLRHRSTIFPEDLEQLGKLRADVLITHESPSTHLFGFKVIDQLAERMGCKLVIHGHHHESYRATLESGIRVRGLGIGEPCKLELDFTCA